MPDKGDRNGSGKIDITVFGPRVITPSNEATVAFDNVYYLCYDLVTRNIDEPTGAHIHEVTRGAGEETTNPRKLTGPVVVDLFSNNVAYKDADGFVVEADEADSTCVTTEDDDVIDEMTEEPARVLREHPQRGVPQRSDPRAGQLLDRPQLPRIESWPGHRTRPRPRLRDDVDELGRAGDDLAGLAVEVALDGVAGQGEGVGLVLVDVGRRPRCGRAPCR